MNEVDQEVVEIDKTDELGEILSSPMLVLVFVVLRNTPKTSLHVPPWKKSDSTPFFSAISL